nr:uncharacterized protein LOC109167502 [Ipomoea batatas]
MVGVGPAKSLPNKFYKSNKGHNDCGYGDCSKNRTRRQVEHDGYGRWARARASSITVPRSDHLSLHLQILPPPIPNPRSQFRFENLWLREYLCREVMLESWARTQGLPLMDRLGRCGKSIWN